MRRFVRQGTWLTGVVLLAALALPNCTTSDVTQAEAKEAMDEANWSTQSSSLTAEVAEISTHFTIGQAVEKSAQQLRDFLQTELPCAQLTVATGAVTIDFGATSTTCLWHGNKMTGSATIAVDRNAANDVQVTHTWHNLSNGKVIVNGTATVTWQAAVGERRVVHNVTATAVDDPTRTLTGSGDRVQKLLDAQNGWMAGVQIDGWRKWTSSKGDWDLSIVGVQVRAADPVPQAGTYTLTTPAGKHLTLEFARVDAMTVLVTVTGMRATFQFKVLSVK